MRVDLDERDAQTAKAALRRPARVSDFPWAKDREDVLEGLLARVTGALELIAGESAGELPLEQVRKYAADTLRVYGPRNIPPREHG